MSVIKKLLILIIFVIFSIILYHLMLRRRSIKSEYGIEGFREGAWFSSPTMDSELAAVKVSDVPAATTDTINPKLPLKQYCIKAAYNAALTGKFVNTEMIKYVLYRGCRFLDFEVFSFDGEPYVAMSTDNTYTTIDTTNKLPLRDVLSTVVNYGFAAPSPINHDPLFVNLRIKTAQTALYDKIASAIQFTIGGNGTGAGRMYLDDAGNAREVTGDTILSDIRDKVIMVLDRSYVPPTYELESPKLAACINIEGGYDTLRKYGYSELSKQQYTSPFVYADGISTDVSLMKMVMPDIGTSWVSLTRNNIYYPMVLNYGAQIVLYPFYQVDQYLGDYERAFANGKSGFVPIGTMVTGLKATVGGDDSVKVGATPTASSVGSPMGSDSTADNGNADLAAAPELENVKQNLKNMVSAAFS